MTTFDFKLVLDQVEIDESEADALYARCKDGTLITASGVTYMDFDRVSCRRQVSRSFQHHQTSVGMTAGRRIP